MKSVVSVTKFLHKALTYKVVLFQEDGNEVIVDFSKSDIQVGLNYKIYDVENPNVTLKTGKLSEDFKITFPMQLTEFEKPLFKISAQKTLSNFGVFVIEFEDRHADQVSQKRDNIFKRFLNG